MQCCLALRPLAYGLAKLPGGRIFQSGDISHALPISIGGLYCTHLLDDGCEPAEGEAVAVLPGDDGAAHLDDDPPGVLQLVPVQDGARALRSLEVMAAAQRDLVAVAVAARVGHGEGAELAADDVARIAGLGGAGVEAAVEHPSLQTREGVDR